MIALVVSPSTFVEHGAMMESPLEPKKKNAKIWEASFKLDISGFEEEFEDPFQCLVDWNSPPIYDQ